MHSNRPVLFFLIIGTLILSATSLNEDDMLGFTQANRETQLNLETQFDTYLKAENMRAWMQVMTAKPHHVGSPHSKANAEYMADLFRSWGYETEIETFEVLFPEPKTRLVELVAPTSFKARLQETTLDDDATSGITKDRLPPYNAYSADGDVTAELVYVNQGIPGDYEDLERMGISVEGKIVLARYGGSWRGIKPKVAAEHGAVGCIIYSDPKDDGFVKGDVYPEGPFRPEQGAQRGSVTDMPLYPGDPLTPGVGAKADTERYTVEESPAIMKIPVLPISYGDALPLLKALAGPVAPAHWRGGLPLTYHVGPGPAKVHLKLEFDWKLETAYNVIAKMQGSTYPDEWIMRGNHHDAWVFGAFDPVSGMVALMEEARAVGELVKSGWHPKRTIVYAGWDAEEPGLLGSTEWVEYHAEMLKDHVAVYINSDSNGRGFLSMGGSHTLEKLVNEVAQAVPDPQTNVSVGDRKRAQLRVNGNAEVDTRSDLRLYPLGSGSDYTPFLQHLGIASLNIGYSGESSGGSYHSLYDSFDHYTRFGDPDFAYGVALAQTAGRITLRLANADVLPLAFNNFADNVALYLKEVTELTDNLREETKHTNELIANNAYQLAADPTKPYIPPQPKAEVPYLNFAPLQNALARLQSNAETYDAALDAHLKQASPLSAEQQNSLNQILSTLEQAMTHPGGLPRRPWFRHQIYAPGFYTGYGVKTLPGVREAIEQRDWEEASAHIEIVAETLNRVAMEIDEATGLLK
jgi:N-acetylated-alpha-linked acidic dipeptidase